MLTSESTNFLFLHIQKTGGTTLRYFLKQVIPDLEQYHYSVKHNSLSDVLKIDRRYSHYYVAAFVRNPWDRLVSWYTDIVTNSRIVSYRDWPKDQPNFQVRQEVLCRCTSFQDFLLYGPDMINANGRRIFTFNQIDYLSDISGNVAVDFIGRFENFNESVMTLIHNLDLHTEIEIPHLRQSQHDGYRAYYTERTREIVCKRFRRDIEYFGYTF